MTTNQLHNSHDIPNNIDFSGGTRGKFYCENAQMQLPIYLDSQVQNTLTDIASAKGIDLSVVISPTIIEQSVQSLPN